MTAWEESGGEGKEEELIHCVSGSEGRDPEAEPITVA